jgi:hypothetical protein
MPHFEIFIKVNRLLNGEHLFFLILCKEIAKNSQKFQNKQGGYKINDKFAFSESASAGIIAPVEALYKKIIVVLQNHYRKHFNSICNYFNPFFPFTFLKNQVLTAEAWANAVRVNTERPYNKYFNN